jgi:hypothetical protein
LRRHRLGVIADFDRQCAVALAGGVERLIRVQFEAREVALDVRVADAGDHVRRTDDTLGELPEHDAAAGHLLLIEPDAVAVVF